LKVSARSASRGFSKRLEVMRKFKRIGTFGGFEGRQEAKYLESLKEGVVTRDHRRTGSQEKRQTVRILYVGSTKSQEPLDLMEEQGRYGEYSERF
jgi:hypothetical protein